MRLRVGLERALCILSMVGCEAPAVRSAPEWTVSKRPVFALGETEPGEPSQFTWIQGVQMLSGGRVLFVTDASKQIFIVDSGGATLVRRGRVGNGPFEFQHLGMLQSVDSTRVAVYDALRQQITVFDPDVLEPEILSFTALGIYGAVPLVRFSNGDFLVRRPGALPEPSKKGVVAGTDSLLRVSGSGAVVAHFGGFPADERVLRPSPNGGVTGGRPPYGRKLLVAANDSLVVVVSSADWEFALYPANGGTPRIASLARPRRRLNAATRRQYRERVLSNVTDEYGRREWTMLSADDVFPEEYPALDLLLVDREGRVWARESVSIADTQANWVVIAGDSLLARVRLPAGFRPFDVGRGRIAGVWTDSLGGEQVQAWSFDRQPRE